jgi:cell wall-associated NlpC family hydrolase
VITHEDVVASARRLLYYPYGHQGRVKIIDGQLVGTRVDCAGELIFVAHDTGVSAFDVLGYSPDPDGESFERMLEEHLVRLDDVFSARPGDVLAFDYGEGVQHVALVTQVNEARRDWRRYTIIHATRRHGVHEALLGWELKKALYAAYRIPELCD